MLDIILDTLEKRERSICFLMKLMAVKWSVVVLGIHILSLIIFLKVFKVR